MKKLIIAFVILLGITSCTKENLTRVEVPTIQLLSEFGGYTTTVPINTTVTSKVRGYLKEGTTISKLNITITKRVNNTQLVVTNYSTTSFQLSVIGSFSSAYPELRNFDLSFQLYSPLVTTGEYTYTVNVVTSDGYTSTNVQCGPYTYF